MASASAGAPPAPPGIKPLFVTETTQKMFGIVPGEDLTDGSRWRMLKRDELLADQHGSKRGVTSCWREAKAELEVQQRERKRERERFVCPECVFC